MNGCDFGHNYLSSDVNALTRRPVTGGHQHRTPITLPEVFPQEPGHMLSRSTKHA